MQTTKRNFSWALPLGTFEWERPLVMGILNLTADSFYEKSRIPSVKELVLQFEKMISEGADILDLGAQSTRPGAHRISAQEEWKALEPGLRAVRKEFPKALISIDTFYADVAEKSGDCGVDIINDISAGSIDPLMFSTMGRLQLPYILMHMRGEPGTMHLNPVFDNVVAEILLFFEKRIEELKAAGVRDIVVDPGFGFGKTMKHNLILLHHLEQMTQFGYPVMAGLSRKKTIQHILDVDATGALNGTTVMNTIALMNGASILRVHDVKAAVEAVKLFVAVKESDDDTI